MTKPCAVPKCRTGYKSEKTKHSVFSVPKDPVRLRKWEEAIPGNVKLRPTHVICDKHFKQRYIRREWIKYDPNDESKIIARATYKYPQLCELAVPTRFDENLEDERAVASIMELDAPILSNPIDTCIKTEPTPLNCLAPSISNNVGIAKDPVKYPQRSKLAVPTRLDGNFENKRNMPIKRNSTMSNTNAKPYSVVSTVTISEKIQKTNSTTMVEYSTDLPNSWSATELCDEKGQRVIFQYIVTKAEKGVKIPVLQKCVALDSDRQLEYFVYGRLVETQGTILNRSSGEPASLRKTLQVFQHMGICAGLGVTCKDVPIEDAYVDYVQQWRHNNCTLISKYKRCVNCTKLRNLVNSRIRNMKNRPTLKRIHRKASNVLDNRKVVALLKRMAQEAYSRKKAEGRANSLTKELEEIREKIAHYYESTLQK